MTWSGTVGLEPKGRGGESLCRSETLTWEKRTPVFDGNTSFDHLTIPSGAKKRKESLTSD